MNTPLSSTLLTCPCKLKMSFKANLASGKGNDGSVCLTIATAPLLPWPGHGIRVAGSRYTCAVAHRLADLNTYCPPCAVPSERDALALLRVRGMSLRVEVLN